MKPLIFTLLLLFTLTGISYAQGPVRDAYPAANIFVIDFQSGQQYQATSDDAILFKDAFVNLVINTRTARMHGSGMVPGHKSVVITQADPQANGTADTTNARSGCQAGKAGRVAGRTRPATGGARASAARSQPGGGY